MKNGKLKLRHSFPAPENESFGQTDQLGECMNWPNQALPLIFLWQTIVTDNGEWHGRKFDKSLEALIIKALMKFSENSPPVNINFTRRFIRKKSVCPSDEFGQLMNFRGLKSTGLSGKVMEVRQTVWWMRMGDLDFKKLHIFNFCLQWTENCTV